MGFTSGIAVLIFSTQIKDAVVADGMVDDKHDSNQELMAQGLANIVSPLFGGIAATSAIARTATNVKSGARSPISGVIHAVTLLVIILAAAPLAKFIPLPAHRRNTDPCATSLVFRPSRPPTHCTTRSRNWMRPARNSEAHSKAPSKSSTHRRIPAVDICNRQAKMIVSPQGESNGHRDSNLRREGTTA